MDRLPDLPLGEVLRRTARDHGGRPALLSDARCLTWAQLDAEVDRVACGWAAMGLVPGDPIAFVMDKRPEVVVGLLACARGGFVYTPVNHKLPPPQVRDQLATAGVRAVVSQASYRHVADAPIHLHVEDWERHQRAGIPSFEATSDTVCYYNYTSGSTGRPKGAATTSRHILANAVATAEGLGFGTDEVYLGMFSVFAHPHELWHRSILSGGAFVIVDTLNPRAIAEVIQRWRVTWMMAVPSFFEMLLDFQESAHMDLSSLRVLEAGGAHVTPDALTRMEAAFSARFLPVWGCTEATGVGLGMLAHGPRKPGSTGKVIPGYELRVVDERGSEAPVGDVGELWIRGEAIVGGYVNQPEETAAQFRDGWYATRDLVRIDADGFVWFVGRRSEMLKIGGIRVFPLEIEQVIAQHPDVRGVVVVRAEERLRGEVARAIIQVLPESKVTVREIQAFCRARLALYAVPRVVEFWREIPKLPNGKIDKKAVIAVAPDGARDER